MANSPTDLRDQTQGARLHKTNNDLQNNAKAASILSLELAKRAWGMKERFKKAMMPLSDAVQLATSVGRDRRPASGRNR